MNHHTSDVAYRSSHHTADSVYVATDPPLPHVEDHSCATSDSVQKAKYSAAGDMPIPGHFAIGYTLYNICGNFIGLRSSRLDGDMGYARADDKANSREGSPCSVLLLTTSLDKWEYPQSCRSVNGIEANLRTGTQNARPKANVGDDAWPSEFQDGRDAK